MTEILWIGRGGQGAFTAAKLLGAAYASKSGEVCSLAFPSFGPERRGAPVRAFTKLDTAPVLDRSETERADYIVILDATLYSPALQSHLKEGGRILVNSKAALDGCITLDADALAQSLRLPVVNTVMLGALSGLSGIVDPQDLSYAISHYMSARIQEKNLEAAARAAQEVSA